MAIETDPDSPGEALNKERAQVQELAIAMNEALILSSLHQHELTQTANQLNAQLLAEIAGRKLAAAALRESEERYRTLFDLGPVGVYSCDVSGKIQDFNRTAVELWGRNPILGDGSERFCGSLKMYRPDGGVIPREHCPMAEVLSGNIPEVRDDEVQIERPDGSRISVVANIRPIKDDLGEISGAINCFFDITERKRAEVESIEARAVAETANRAKSDFLSNMSHELRTPLNGILGFAQLIEGGSPPPTPSQKCSIDHILKAGWYLLELINEVLDLAVVESGKLVMERESVPLAEVMLECHAIVEVQAQKRGIGLTFPGLEASHHVKADRIRVKQVLVNLLSNAIKYNRPTGTVRVEYVLTSPGLIRIEVRDTGVGLTPEQLVELFQPFHRLGKDASAEEGTGIGLVVSKRLVELMGGAIGAESTVGVGSVFWIVLSLTAAPQAVKEAAQTAPARTQSPAGGPVRTVLYVDDNAVNRELVEQLIARRSELSLLSAADATVGIALARALQPEVILMDIKLPGMSGIEACKILRADASTTHIPIIALSGNAMPGDIEKALKAGFLDYITKPINVERLMDALDAALVIAQMASGRPVQKKPR
ncbi:MAG: ATP-binding protein [Gammaproteobacteria bacterium]